MGSEGLRGHDSQRDCRYERDEREDHPELALGAHPECETLVDEHARLEHLERHRDEGRTDVPPRVCFNLGQRERHGCVPSVPAACTVMSVRAEAAGRSGGGRGDGDSGGRADGTDDDAGKGEHAATWRAGRGEIYCIW